MDTNQYLSRRPMVLGLAKVLFLALAQLPFIQAAPLHMSKFLRINEAEEGQAPDDPGLWLNLSFAAFLVLLGGAFAGLTIALMGQDEIYLQVIQDSGEGKEKIHATKVLKLLQRGKHWVLVTLLLSNVITNETLPIVLDRSLGGGWPAVLGSTVLIVIFGEIVPQSICVRFGLPIGAWMSPFVLSLMYIMAPVAWPTAKLLDYLLGKDHGTVYKKAGLKTLVSLHRSLGEAGQRLHADEVTIISAVLDLKEKPIGSIMTPMDDVFTLSLDDVLDEDTMDDILSQGYSRIPVHHPDNDENFVGMLLVKMLITYDPEDAKPVRDFALATLPETKPDTSCLDIVNFFQEGKSHMVLVSNHPGEDSGSLGVVTLEDVIEELIGEEIVDESDVFIDIHKAIRRITPAPRMRYASKVDKPSLQRKLSNLLPGASNADLADIAEGEPLDLQRVKTADAVAPAPSNVDPRRASSQSVGGDAKHSKRAANFEEVKEHLKHLGPSNLASRPKSTRYTAVKIKPGSEANGTLHGEVSPVRTQLNRRISEGASDFAGGIGEGLLKSGGRDASDGALAVAHGYGAITNSPNERRPQSASKAIQAEPLDLNGTPPRSPRNQALKPPTMTADSDDTVGELPNSQRSKSLYYTHQGPARSGSITENIIDTNGIRKVVLETTSSSESTDDDDNNGANLKNHRSTSSQASHGSLESHAKLRGGGDQHEQNTHSVDDNMVKKKKKRHRKKAKQGKGDETEPLLG